eukprot:scaffold4637_cov128-Cylindrotheca_fusiformis.AAC.45
MAHIETVCIASPPINAHANEGRTDDQSCTDGSVDTQDAFLDMLGIPGGLQSMDDVADEFAEEENQIARHNYFHVALPPRCSRYLNPPETCLAFSIEHFCSKLECDQLIQRAASATEQGFHYVLEAAHRSPDGVSYPVKLQNPNPHKLSVFYHPPTITRMWRKLKPCIHPLIEDFIKRENCGPPLGLNPKLRVLRYDHCDSDRFEPHFDATTRVGQQKSLLTVLLYLNDGGGRDFQGGDTLYLDGHISSKDQIENALSKASNSISKVTPMSGKVVIFEHDLFHSGAPLVSGTKYVLRTDVLFAGAEDEVSDKTKETCTDDAAEGASNGILVSDLCTDHLKVPDQVLDKLDGMGMLEMTLESFLVPGTPMLKAMLLEEISDELLVDRILKKAFTLSRNS